MAAGDSLFGGRQPWQYLLALSYTFNLSDFNSLRPSEPDLASARRHPKARVGAASTERLLGEGRTEEQAESGLRRRGPKRIMLRPVLRWISAGGRLRLPDRCAPWPSKACGASHLRPQWRLVATVGGGWKF